MSEGNWESKIESRVARLEATVNKSDFSGGLSCPVCGGKMVYIRGKHPGDDKRKVCPTCLQERMDNINNISSRDYNIAYENGAT